MPASPRAAAPSSRLPSLTGLRFAAALLVFGVHAYSFIPVGGFAHDLGHLLLDPGDLGVSFFFVLSGFVLTWAAKGGSARPLGRFFAGRVLRIYPAYVVALALAVASKWVGDLADPVGNRMNQVNGHNLTTSLFLVQAWYPDDVTYLGINPVAWSLSCEIAFYAAFPLLLPLLRRLTGRALAGAAAFFVVLGLLMPLIAHLFVDPAYQRWFVYVLPATRAVEFALGITLALLVRSGAWRGPGLPLASALFAANYLVVNLLPHQVRDTAAVLATTALLIPAAATADLTGARSIWRHPVLVRLGDASYAFFLVHLTIVTTAMTILGRSHDYPAWQAMSLGMGFLVVSYAVALPLHRYVEAPAMRLLRRRGSRAPIPAQRSRQPEQIGVG
ncbi:Peptidoglycan/LPS O-acetylase OafA/YrhL, contains acyltransferase and SGNH-hydrolase domains [Asanoa hainanensis]|uniref:Peptidoglycan/LPS O-acetylase OafA/YrhL, contains acyltransferase and SGNH-hydrolase domains n=1 Tax=Asanoa hainanensis TaxID=560556 RepID=A0A239FRN1_9ACTN|nr:acyltransferase [Asanoa hainanensis]SNS59520.1 Peptidoglycan/LPS O-acetylase OafA/YrhL, contains acyltransferase and SGNH-hydrolase domains [Asanoa hainanensis]